MNDSRPNYCSSSASWWTGTPGKRRLCEERIILLRARSARAALSAAKRSGKKSSFHYANSDGNPVHFEFVGVLGLIHLGEETDAQEVWYDITERMTPMERAEKILPKESALSAIRSWRPD